MKRKILVTIILFTILLNCFSTIIMAANNNVANNKTTNETNQVDNTTKNQNTTSQNKIENNVENKDTNTTEEKSENTLENNTDKKNENKVENKTEVKNETKSENKIENNTNNTEKENKTENKVENQINKAEEEKIDMSDEIDTQSSQEGRAIESNGVQYRTHVQYDGWQYWKKDGEMAGTVGKGLRIEGIKIRIVSKYKKHYIGIDVSHWQGDINYEKLVASQKIDFMITKVGWYSENNKRFIVDSKFEKNYKLAKQNKIPLGIYLYSYAKNVEDAKLEANELIKYLKSSGNSSFELPIFYDIEEDSQISYGKKAITDITIAFCETMKNAGYEVGVYSYSYWLNNYMEILRLPADYSLWGADYGTNNNGQIPSDLDKYSKTYDIWQFTDKAQIDGINGYVDMNVCYKKYF